MIDELADEEAEKERMERWRAAHPNLSEEDAWRERMKKKWGSEWTSGRGVFTESSNFVYNDDEYSIIGADLTEEVSLIYVKAFPDLVRFYEKKPAGSQTMEAFGKAHWKRHEITEPARAAKMLELGYLMEGYTYP